MLSVVQIGWRKFAMMETTTIVLLMSDGEVHYL